MAKYIIYLCALLLVVGAPVIGSTTSTFEDVLNTFIDKSSVLNNSTTTTIQNLTDTVVNDLTEGLGKVSAVSEALTSLRKNTSDATCLAYLDALNDALNTSIANATTESDQIVTSSDSYIEEFSYSVGSISNDAANLISDLDSCTNDTLDAITAMYCILTSEGLTERFKAIVSETNSLATNATTLILDSNVVQEEGAERVKDNFEDTFSSNFFQVMIACNLSSTFVK